MLNSHNSIASILTSEYLLAYFKDNHIKYRYILFLEGCDIFLYICRCGSTDFEEALTLSSQALIEGVTPPMAKKYLRCVVCHTAIEEANKQTSKCPICSNVNIQIMNNPEKLFNQLTYCCVNCNWTGTGKGLLESLSQ